MQSRLPYLTHTHETVKRCQTLRGWNRKTQANNDGADVGYSLISENDMTKKLVGL